MDARNSYKRGRPVVSAMHVLLVIATTFQAELKEFNGERDHVHLLINYPPKVAVSKLVNSLKGGLCPPDTPGVHRPDQPRPHTRAPVVTPVLLGILRWSTAGVRQYIRQHKSPL